MSGTPLAVTTLECPFAFWWLWIPVVSILNLIQPVTKGDDKSLSVIFLLHSLQYNFLPANLGQGKSFVQLIYFAQKFFPFKIITSCPFQTVSVYQCLWDHREDFLIKHHAMPARAWCHCFYWFFFVKQCAINCDSTNLLLGFAVNKRNLPPKFQYLTWLVKTENPLIFGLLT